jgi:molybdate transport system substrate-binding protein
MRFIVCLLFFLLLRPCWAAQAQVAVAANFSAPMKQIAAQFQQATGHSVTLSLGATAKFYAQIKNGAPFDLLLAADQATPTRLAREQLAIGPSQFTYALGKLVLWSATKRAVDREVLKQGKFTHLAIASPQAPYGIAAKDVLMSLHLFKILQPKLVQGESVGQTYSFVATGNAELGFVALSQIVENPSGSTWIVPENLYQPLRQDAILLKHGQANPAALALLAYLKSDSAKKIMCAYGYH